MSNQETEEQWLDDLLDQLVARTLHNAFGDEEYHNNSISDAKQAILSKLQEREQFQVYFEKQKFVKSDGWVGRIAFQGKQVYGDVHKNEAEGRKALNRALTELSQKGQKENE